MGAADEVREISRAWHQALLEQQAAARKLVITGLGPLGRACGASKKTLYKWIKMKGFPAFKMDGQWLSVPADILKWMEKQRVEAMARKDEK